MELQDLLDKDSIKAQLAELLDDLDTNFDNIGAIALVWQVGGSTKHRIYGTGIGVLGLLTLAYESFKSMMSNGTKWGE